MCGGGGKGREGIGWGWGKWEGRGAAIANFFSSMKKNGGCRMVVVEWGLYLFFCDGNLKGGMGPAQLSDCFPLDRSNHGRGKQQSRERCTVHWLSLVQQMAMNGNLTAHLLDDFVSLHSMHYHLEFQQCLLLLSALPLALSPRLPVPCLETLLRPLVRTEEKRTRRGGRGGEGEGVV